MFVQSGKFQVCVCLFSRYSPKECLLRVFQHDSSDYNIHFLSPFNKWKTSNSIRCTIGLSLPNFILITECLLRSMAKKPCIVPVINIKTDKHKAHGHVSLEVSEEIFSCTVSCFQKMCRCLLLSTSWKSFFFVFRFLYLLQRTR